VKNMDYLPTSRKLAVEVALSCLMLTGCVIPYISGEIPPSEYKRNVDKQTCSMLEIGKTTRKEVLLKLGEPDKVLDNDDTFIYEGEKTSGKKLWDIIYIMPAGGYSAVVGSGGIGHGAEYEGYRLVVKFNPMGVVVSHDFELFTRKEERK